MKIVAEPLRDSLVISFLSSAIQNETEVKEAGEMLKHYLMNSVEKNIVLDLSRVKFMTSAMIGELVKFKKKCDVEKRRLKLCGLSRETAEVFKISRLEKLFKIYANRKKAGVA